MFGNNGNMNGGFITTCDTVGHDVTLYKCTYTNGTPTEFLNDSYIGLLQAMEAYGVSFEGEEEYLDRKKRIRKGTHRGIPVAVKFIRIEALNRRVRREIAHMIKVNCHSNTVLYKMSGEVGTEENEIFIIMELCGQALSQLVDKIPEIIDYKTVLLHIAKGLSFIHSKNILHRKLHPDNILMSSDGKQMKISNFWFSKSIDPNANKASMSYGEDFAKGWMPPEVLRKFWIKKSDVFQEGLLFYFTVSNGIHPYDAEIPKSAKKKTDLGDDKKKENLQEQINDDTFSPQLSGIRCQDPDLARHMILEMLQHDMGSRPTAEEVLMHPYFWEDEKKMLFLHEVCGKLEQLKEILRDDECLMLENLGPQLLENTDWKALPSPIPKFLCKIYGTIKRKGCSNDITGFDGYFCRKAKDSDLGREIGLSEGCCVLRNYNISSRKEPHALRTYLPLTPNGDVIPISWMLECQFGESQTQDVTIEVGIICAANYMLDSSEEIPVLQKGKEEDWKIVEHVHLPQFNTLSVKTTVPSTFCLGMYKKDLKRVVFEVSGYLYKHGDGNFRPELEIVNGFSETRERIAVAQFNSFFVKIEDEIAVQMTFGNGDHSSTWVFKVVEEQHQVSLIKQPDQNSFRPNRLCENPLRCQITKNKNEKWMAVDALNYYFD